MPATAIRQVHGRRVWDSRGRPTVEAEIDVGVGRGRARDCAGRRVHRIGRGGRPSRRGRLRRSPRGRERQRSDCPRAGGRRRGGPGERSTACSSRPTARRTSGASAATPRSRSRWQRFTPRRRLTARRSGDTSRRTRPACPLPEIQIFGGGAHAGATHRHPGPDGGLPVGDIVSPKRSTGPRPSIARPAATWRSADCCKASRTRAATGRRSPPTRRRSTRCCARSKRPGLCPGSDAAISLDIAASQFGASRQRTAWPATGDARQRRPDRAARPLDRAIPDRLHRGPSGRGRYRRVPTLHRRLRR